MAWVLVPPSKITCSHEVVTAYGDCVFMYAYMCLGSKDIKNQHLSTYLAVHILQVHNT
jgi:hypothetical protein